MESALIPTSYGSAVQPPTVTQDGKADAAIQCQGLGAPQSAPAGRQRLAQLSPLMLQDPD